MQSGFRRECKAHGMLAAFERRSDLKIAREHGIRRAEITEQVPDQAKKDEALWAEAVLLVRIFVDGRD
jgi:hypothetical protein